MVEDSAGTVAQARKAIEEYAASVQLTTRSSGADAAHQLNTAPLPDIIILDPNLPDMFGLDLLRKFKGEPRLRTIPVVVLSGSNRDSDIRAAYEAGAASFVCKPVGYADLKKLLHNVLDYWNGVVRLPAP